MRIVLSLVLACSLLSGCGGIFSTLTRRDEVREFVLEARFALRVAESGQAVQNSGGRLSWIHAKNGSDRLLFSSPLGVGLAQIDMNAEQARLQTADGQTRISSDPATLMQEITGHSLPIDRLPDWLLGRASDPLKASFDELQRPLSLTEGDWQVDYEYPDANPDALPAQVNLSRGKSIQLRLRIEEWRLAP